MRKEKGLIAIRIAGLSEGVHEYDFTCSATDFKDPELNCPEFRNGIRVRVVAQKTDSEIIVDIETATLAEFSCDICLAPVRRELTGSYRIVFVYSENREEQEGEYRPLEHNALSIDLTEDVRETLLLSLPMKVVCTGNPDCGVYTNEADERSEEKNAWQESLEKLKGKFQYLYHCIGYSYKKSLFSWQHLNQKYRGRDGTRGAHSSTPAARPRRPSPVRTAANRHFLTAPAATVDTTRDAT